LGADSLPVTTDNEPTTSLATQMENIEKSLIKTALDTYGNCLKDTYEALAISRKTLYDKMQKYNIVNGKLK
jgi:two-component system C4-dicarboxylate transport response regulator DctD